MSTPDTQTLNKFLASAGLCSRRKAEEFIKEGDIRINGAVVTEPYHQVSSKDIVSYRKKPLKVEGKMYLVVNKPQMVLTTCSDPDKRPIILDLVKGATKKRLFHIGRLDFMTTGLVLLTNDGELAQKLSHPSYKIKKTYKITLHKPMNPADLQRIRKGIYLPDGKVTVDFAAASTNFKALTIQLHNGKNRIIRRVFEKLGYHIKRLDRTSFGPIFKKKLTLGNWRHLTKHEVSQLKDL